MNRELIIRPEAEVDLLTAYRWYESRLTGLGEELLLSVERSLSLILENPLLHPCIHKNVRRILIQKFPFGLFYLDENNKITVIAVLHASRNPKEWKKRA